MQNTKKMFMGIRRIAALVLICALLLAGGGALAESYSAAVTASVMVVYSDPYFASPVGTLSYHDIVVVTATKENVAQLVYGGYTLYGALSDLTAISEIGTLATFICDTRVYESASTSSRSAYVSAGTQVYVLAEQSGCAMIEKNGVVAYAYSSCLKKESTSFDPIEESATDSTGAITPTDGSVAIATIPVTIAQTSVKVYRSASTSSNVLGTLSYGQTVTVRAYNNAWAYIELGGYYGFCSLSALRKTDGSSSSSTETVTTVTAVVNTDTVPVYQSASTSSTYLGSLTWGTQVNVISYDSTWAYIELSGRYGYCPIAGLRKTSQGTTQLISKGQATVITAGARFYETASTNARNGALPIGATVDVYSYDSTWAYCGYLGYRGCILISCLSATGYDELESGDTGAAVTNLESALLALGYFDGVPGTTYNAQTTQAVERLQSACGMNVTGIANEATQRVLFGGNAPCSPLLSLNIAQGTKNVNVKRIQQRLYSLGYFSLSSSVDGDYGSNTAAAVKLFQSAAGLSATGACDSTTLRTLYAASAPKLPSGSKAADASSSSSSSSSSGGVTGNTAAMPGSLASSVTSYSASMNNAQKLEYVIYVAQNQLGKRYVYATAGTSTFDCSGFTMYCFGKIGISLKHSAYTEGYNNSREKIASVSSLKRGDLVFFNTVSDSDLCDHVGIYLGSNSFIHASSGAGKVVVSNIGSGYYNRVFSWGRRVLDT